MTNKINKCDGNHVGPRCADPECWNDAPVPTAGSVHPVPVDDTGYGMVRPPAGGEPEVYRKPADYWEGYTAHVCYKDINDLKEMVHHLEGVLDDVPEGELVDRAHVTRLQAELAEANKWRESAEGGWREANRVIAMQRERLDTQESELTKARELLVCSATLMYALNPSNTMVKELLIGIDAFSNQSAPVKMCNCNQGRLPCECK